MNFIPQKSEPNGNYLCTWALQASAAKNSELKATAAPTKGTRLTPSFYLAERIYIMFTPTNFAAAYIYC